MIIIKLIGITLIIGSSSGIGFYFSNYLKNRITDLGELKKSILILRGEIRYGNTPLPEAIESIGKKNNRLSNFFAFVGQELMKLNGIPFYTIWTEGIRIGLKESHLNKQDKETLSKLGETLGYLDKEMQINLINLYIEELEAEIKESFKIMKEKSYLYNTLGVMAGIFIAIVML